MEKMFLNSNIKVIQSIRDFPIPVYLNALFPFPFPFVWAHNIYFLISDVRESRYKMDRLPVDNLIRGQ